MIKNKAKKNKIDSGSALKDSMSPQGDFGKSSAESDERRLFYVALTRARKGVTVTYAKTGENGREQLPSQFVGEIRKDLIEELDASKFEKDFETTPPFGHPSSIEEGKGGDGSPPAGGGVALSAEVVGENQQFVREIFERQGLSVTALNNYLECPWNFFYSNLLRLPKAQNKHMMYGTAIHAALRDFFKQLKDREIPKNLLESFEFHLNKQPLSERDLAEVLEKGRKALAGYYDKYYKSWERNVLTEFEIKGVALEVGLQNFPEVRLQGNLDKIEFLGSGNEVNVVDYKTRQPLSRNEIEKRGYKRQLTFYKLLLDNYENGKYKFTTGELDFIEPTEKKEYKKEKFIITEEEIIELKETIKKAVDEIVNLKFWNKKCDDKACSYCSLRDLII